MQMRKIARDNPQLFSAYQSYSAHEILPEWAAIRKNLSAILGEHGTALFKKSSLFHYILLRAFQVDCKLSNFYNYEPTRNHSPYLEFTIVFRLGTEKEAVLKLVDNINSRFGSASASLAQQEGTFKGDLLMFDIAISKQLLNSHVFIKLLGSTYDALRASPDSATQDYIDNQFIAAKLLPQSCLNLALQLAEFDARHIPASKNIRAMKILINLIVELKEALAEQNLDRNKLQTLSSKIHKEIQGKHVDYQVWYC